MKLSEYMCTIYTNVSKDKLEKTLSNRRLTFYNYSYECKIQNHEIFFIPKKCKITWEHNSFIPVIRCVVITNGENTELRLRYSIRKSLKYFFIIYSLILFLFEMLFVFSTIRQRSFNFVIVIPLIMFLFGSLLIFISLRVNSRILMKLIEKILKDDGILILKE